MSMLSELFNENVEYVDVRFEVMDRKYYPRKRKIFFFQRKEFKGGYEEVFV